MKISLDLTVSLSGKNPGHSVFPSPRDIFDRAICGEREARAS